MLAPMPSPALPGARCPHVRARSVCPSIPGKAGMKCEAMAEGETSAPTAVGITGIKENPALASPLSLQTTAGRGCGRPAHGGVRRGPRGRGRRAPCRRGLGAWTGVCPHPARRRACRVGAAQRADWSPNARFEMLKRLRNRHVLVLRCW